MNRDEQLRIEQEELFFKRLLNEFDKADAQKYNELNEKLKNDPAYDEPEEVTREMLRFIQQEEKKKMRPMRHRKIKRVVLCVAAIIMLTGVVAYASIPSFRTKALNLLLDASKVATRMTISDDKVKEKPTDDERISNETNKELLGYKLPGVPEGFEVTEENEGKSRAWIQYSNDEGKSIKFQVYYGSERKVVLDTEDANDGDIIVHGYEGLLSAKGDYAKVFWYDTDTKASICIETEGFAPDIAEELANKIEYVGK